MFRNLMSFFSPNEYMIGDKVKYKNKVGSIVGFALVVRGEFDFSIRVILQVDPEVPHIAVGLNEIVPQ